VRAGIAVALVLATAITAGCQREQRRFSEVSPSSARPDTLRMSQLQPGGARPAAAGPYDANGWGVAEGQRLYTWFNCVGCHAQGGGGIGPPLMDDKWIYGSEPANVYASIVQGRPNGMPSFAGKIGDAQVWQLVAYVRSMSGQLRKDVRPNRTDHMNVKEAESAKTPERPTSANVPPSAERAQ
jgi:cytochrome c oxidase cbb3-type subunit III